MKELTRAERLQLGAALLLLKRNDVPLARRVLAMENRVKLVEELSAYIKQHSRHNNKVSPGY